MISIIKTRLHDQAYGSIPSKASGGLGLPVGLHAAWPWAHVSSAVLAVQCSATYATVALPDLVQLPLLQRAGHEVDDLAGVKLGLLALPTSPEIFCICLQMS